MPQTIHEKTSLTPSIKKFVQPLADTLFKLGFPGANYGDSRQYEQFTNGPFIKIDLPGQPDAAYRKSMLNLREKMLRLLQVFYQKHPDTDYGAHLILKNIGAHGAFFLICQDMEILNIGDKRYDNFSKIKNRSTLNRHRKEFQSFTQFLQQFLQ